MERTSNNQHVIYMDVDDMIVRPAGTKRIPILNVIQAVRRLKAEGVELYCWSFGGAEYARQTAGIYGLEDCFTESLPKTTMLLDD